MTFLTNSRCQNCKDHLNLSTDNRDMADKAHRYVVCEYHPSQNEAEPLTSKREAELLTS